MRLKAGRQTRFCQASYCRYGQIPAQIRLKCHGMSEMDKLKKKIIIISVIVLCAVIFAALAFDVRLKTVQYTVRSDKVGDTVRIVLITDLHSCKYGDNQQTLTDAINEQEPDILLFGGDICDDKLPHDNEEILLNAVAGKYPCYYVTGNHEYWSGEADKITEMFRSYGVTVLEGTYEIAEINGQRLKICGIDDPAAEKYAKGSSGIYSQLEALKSARDDDYFTILLSHRPEYIETYLQYGFDLVLSGHAHGGQWRIPGILNGLLSPDQGWFPKYAGGKYTFDHCEMIVSRGLARESTRVPRIFNRPELVVVEIAANNDETG